jgi:hypothetical protein
LILDAAGRGLPALPNWQRILAKQTLPRRTGGLRAAPARSASQECGCDSARTSGAQFHLCQMPYELRTAQPHLGPNESGAGAPQSKSGLAATKRNHPRVLNKQNPTILLWAKFNLEPIPARRGLRALPLFTLIFGHSWKVGFHPNRYGFSRFPASHI